MIRFIIKSHIERFWNNYQLRKYFCAFIVITISQVALIKIIKGGRFDALQAALLISPFVVIFIYSLRDYWFSILIGLLVLNFAFPVFPLDRLKVPVLAVSVILGFYFLDLAISKGQKAGYANLLTKLMLLLAIGITLRIIIDPPGSARVGSSGGMREAMLYLIGAWGYFAMRLIGEKCTYNKKHIHLILSIALLSLIYAILRSAIFSTKFYMGLFYHRQMWLIAPIVLSLIISSSSINYSKRRWFIIAGFLFIMFAILALHRSRPVFAFMTVLTISNIYGQLRKTVIALSLIGFITLGGMLIINKGILPKSIQRSVSIIVPISEEIKNRGVEYGWRSRFRLEMSKLAWMDIKKNPLAGKGFKFSKAELLAADPDQIIRKSRTMALSLTGGYHNSVIALAVFCGIPLAILFFVNSLFISGKFLIFATDLEYGNIKLISAVVAGFFVASFGQMLMNGAGYDFFCTCILLGAMAGIMNKISKSVQKDTKT